TIKSSNIFGKIGDWLGNIFIFESIGGAAFLVAFLFSVCGLIILKINYFKPWKTIGHSLFFICWLPIFFGAITKGEGVLSGVYGFQIMDFLNSVIGTAGLWLVILVSIALYFILEFNLNPSNIKSKLTDLNDNTVGRVKGMLPKSAESFEADEELEKISEEDSPLITVTESAGIRNENIATQVKNSVPEPEFETIKTPNQ